MRNQGLSGIYLIAFLTMAISILFMLFPQRGLEAALRGVSIWWDILFPALFPFFVISELLLGFGIVHFLGTMLDPMMRPVFRIPGIGGFVMAMGFASGYPVGARLTSQLWEQQLVDRDEGERLVAFTSSSDPIFLIGAVSIGFFQDVSLALILAIAHYGGAVIIGLLMRFHGSPRTHSPQQTQTKGRIWKRALLSMHTARIKDGRPIGVLLNQAVHSSLGLSFVVGGLVIFFSVVLEVLTAGHVMGFLYILIQSVLQLTGLPASLSEAVIKGIFEVTLGAKAAGAAADSIPLVNKTAVAAFILSWAGLSVHAQIVSLLSNTNMRYLPFLTARFVHGIISALIVVLLWQPLQSLRSDLSVFMPNYDSNTLLSSYLRWLMPTSAFLFIATFVMIAVLYMVYSFFKMMHKMLSRSL